MKFFKNTIPKEFEGEQNLITIQVLCPPDSKFQDSIENIFKIFKQQAMKNAGIEVIEIKTDPITKEQKQLLLQKVNKEQNDNDTIQASKEIQQKQA